MAKRYSPAEWAELTPAQIAALIPKTYKEAVESGLPGLIARVAAPASGDFASADFGWSCRSCGLTSSHYPGVPGYISFDLHTCDADLR
jgi:hypothetical protein